MKTAPTKDKSWKELHQYLKRTLLSIGTTPYFKRQRVGSLSDFGVFRSAFHNPWHKLIMSEASPVLVTNNARNSIAIFEECLNKSHTCIDHVQNLYSLLNRKTVNKPFPVSFGKVTGRSYLKHPSSLLHL